VLAGNLTIAGLMLMCSLIVPQDIEWLVIMLTMVGKMCITASYGTIYLFSVEQFPTVIRNVALGCCSMSARFGATISPFLIHLGYAWKPLPILMFGIWAFIGGALTMFLPETCKVNLPDTLKDAEKLGNNNNNNVARGQQEELVEFNAAK
jgi:MFS transporter, OCT family, solute carrier family 22 (organic cation transporter), member 4/5